MSELLDKAYVDVYDTAHSGIIVGFGEQRLKLEHPVQPTWFWPGFGAPKIRMEASYGEIPVPFHGIMRLWLA